MKSLSVVIVVYKSEKHIGPCLDVLERANDIGEKLEVLVVDNEPEGVVERQRRLTVEHPALDLRYIPNDRNGGYGQGNNVGIRNARAPLILIMNPDVRLTGTTPGRICAAFDGEPRLALLGMRQFLGNGTRGRSFLWAPALPAGLPGRLLLLFSNKTGFFFPRWECIQGSCFVLRKSVFESIGMFDETVFMYGEEQDIHERIRQGTKMRIACDWSMSYQHLTDQRDCSFSTAVKNWEVAIRRCGKNGIREEQYWKRVYPHLRLLLWRQRMRHHGGDQATIEFLERQLDFVLQRLASASNHNGKT